MPSTPVTRERAQEDLEMIGVVLLQSISRKCQLPMCLEVTLAPLCQNCHGSKRLGLCRDGEPETEYVREDLASE